MANWYWKGQNSTSWTGTNWASAADGTEKAGYPNGAAEHVYMCTTPTRLTINVDAAVQCGILNMSGAAVVLTGSAGGQFITNGSVTFGATAPTFNTSAWYLFGTGTLETGGHILTAGYMLIGSEYSAANITLGSNPLVYSGVALRIARSFNTNNQNVTASIIRDDDGGFTRTLTLGSSAIVCTQWSFISTGLTLSAASLTSLTVNSAIANTNNFGNGTYGGTVTVNGGAYVTTISGNNSFTNLTLDQVAASRVGYFNVSGANTVTGTLTLSGDSQVNRPMVKSSTNGTERIWTLTGATVNQTDVDLADMHYNGAPTVNSTRVGDCGGNTDVGATAQKTVYAVGLSSDKDWFNNVWSNTSGGAASLNYFPLPQDIAVIDNSSGTGTLYMSHPRTSGVDTSIRTNALTLKAAGPSITIYGSIDLSGSGISCGGGWPQSPYIITFDARVASTLTIVGKGTTSTGTGGITINSYGGTVQLASNLTHTGAFSLLRGTFDQNDFDLSSGSWTISAATTARTYKPGTGTLTVTGVTGTILNFGTATGLTWNPDGDDCNIKIGDSARTLTGTVIVDFGHLTVVDNTTKNFHNVTMTKHKGNYAYQINGDKEVDSFTMETPDASTGTDYIYNMVQFEAGHTLLVNDAGGFLAEGNTV